MHRQFRLSPVVKITQGLPQYIYLTFTERVIPKQLFLTFQGGFVGTQCTIHIQPYGSPNWQTLTHLYPEDVNRRQSFDLTTSGLDDGITSLKVVFENSSDFFGRITVYGLGLEGFIM